ncbi:MAG TPA: hotdog fold thioesterase [Chitinophagaceae bacterium]|nr:hotdog fold thioesterase [Chitinophagaceae bacterium]
MVWFNKNLRLEDVSALGKGTMGDYIGIEWVEIGTDYLKARMPVDHRTNQPYGLLHGGASVVLAETIGSIGSALVVDHTKFYCVGLEVNANHIRGARNGFVTGTGIPLHLGKSTHVWEIKIIDEQEKLICVSRLTVAILPRK